MQNLSNQPVSSGSPTPHLEGAPCSIGHENRSLSVIRDTTPRNAPALGTGEEGTPCRP